MASESEEEEFLGFENEDVERARERGGQQSSDESDISVDLSDSEESSGSDDEEIVEEAWSTDDSPVRVHEFTERTGATSRIAEDGTALDFFLLMFPEDLFEILVTETNRNAEQLIRTKPDPRWYATTCEEMRAFVAINILFGIKTLPETRLYWSKDSFLGVPSIQKVMPRNRFEKIRQYLHLNNRENMLPRGDRGYDKLFRVRPLLDVISRTFSDEYRPSKFVSIDEAMVKYKGRLGFKQYMPMKPVKRGIKVWVRADAMNGFVCAIQVYTGKEGQQPEHGLGYRVVSDLVRDLHGKNYHIFCDNFFTSVRLAEDLLSNNLYLCGTTRSNRTDFPADLKPNKAEVKALRRGESLFRRKGGIVATVWKDKKIVSFLSTQCEVRGNETVSRKQKDGTIIQVPTVPVVQLYNKFMGGVDHSDQMRQYYQCSRRAEKWWRYLLWFGLDVCIVNAHILMLEADNFPNFTQLQFRLELVKMLIGNFISRKQHVLDGTVNGNHWPVPMAKGRCKRCLKNGKTTFCRLGCELCGLRLCLACFKNHHLANL